MIGKNKYHGMVKSGWALVGIKAGVGADWTFASGI
ncbi:hypothetical protein ES703_07776 [subsurface metagenome]